MMLSLSKYLLKSILKKKCKATVPRSGEEGETVNCFHTYLYDKDQPYLLALDIIENKITGKLYTKDGFYDEASIPLEEINKYKIHITHHYGLYDTKYIGLLGYAITGHTKIDSLKCILRKLFTDSKQYIFNKKKFATIDRLEILRALIDMQFRGIGTKFMTMDLMTHLYSELWIMHPDKINQEHRIQIFIDSFVKSGELEFDGSCNYTVTNNAIITLSHYEEQERRHLENQNLQKIMLHLTFAIVVAGITQAAITYYK